jgi:hypothetical protein
VLGGVPGALDFAGKLGVALGWAAHSEGVHGTSLTKSDDGVRTVAGQAANNASMEGELSMQPAVQESTVSTITRKLWG